LASQSGNTPSRTPAKRKPAAKKAAPARKAAAKSPRGAAAKTAKTAKAPRPTKAAKPAPEATTAAPAPAAKSNKLAPFTANLRKQVIAALDELKARDVKEIDVREKASFTDLLVIASGTSTRHVKSIADEVVKFSKRAGVMPLGVEGEKEAEWVLVDLGDIVVHVMLPRIREFYALERLWLVGDEAPPESAGALAG
jgi:ribosome silencing factor RsfS/YbeB/iojap